MFINSVRYFFRSCLRHKLFTFINITGLAFAIAFIILIGQFIYHEYSYNSVIKDVENIYRLINARENNPGYSIDYLIKDQILENVPGVKDVCIMNKFQIEVNHGSNVFQFDHMLVVDTNFLNVFNIAFIKGDKTALNSIDGVVLTETSAIKIFGSTNVIGKSLTINHDTEMYVTGVVKDMPQNVSLQVDLLLNYENSIKGRVSYAQLNFGDITSYPFNVFIQTVENADISNISKQIKNFHNLEKIRYPEKVSLVPLKSNYFNIEYNDYELQHGNIRLVKILALIGIIILFLAVINFINLTTAGYKYRMSELGIKKCLGVKRFTLISQLMLEAFLICFLSSMMGIGFAELLLPYFNQFIDKPLHLQIFTNLNFSILFVSFIIILSLLAGLFPAIILSKISPLHLFKHNPYLRGTGKVYRNILTTFQFTVSIVLIFCLIVISNQINYVKHKDLGFNTEQLLYIPVHYKMADKLQALTDKFRQYHGTKNLSLTMGVPGGIRVTTNSMNVIAIDTAALSTFGFKIIKGRNLLPGDFRKACFINETAKKEYKDEEFEQQKFQGFDIIGVVSDFHFSSMYKKNEPLVLLFTDEWGLNCISIRVHGSVEEAINYIKDSWKEISPDYPIDIQFYDEYFAAMYRKEENLAALLGIFSILAVVISCMGIFGLAVFQSEQKIKEIGIRKVLGAAPHEITYLLTKNFTKWVILANILAVPAAYYFMNKWLDDFAYKIEITWWMFALAGGIALVIALATVSFQAIKAATANPVDSLKYE